MNVTAKFVIPEGHVMCVELRCGATGALKAIIPHQPESRRSMTWISEQYAREHGHTIQSWDRSALTNDEHEHENASH